MQSRFITEVRARRLRPHRVDVADVESGTILRFARGSTGRYRRKLQFDRAAIRPRSRDPPSLRPWPRAQRLIGTRILGPSLRDGFVEADASLVVANFTDGGPSSLGRGIADPARGDSTSASASPRRFARSSSGAWWCLAIAKPGASEGIVRAVPAPVRSAPAASSASVRTAAMSPGNRRSRSRRLRSASCSRRRRSPGQPRRVADRAWPCARAW